MRGIHAIPKWSFVITACIAIGHIDFSSVMAQSGAQSSRQPSNSEDPIAKAGNWTLEVTLKPASSNALVNTPRQYVPATVRLGDQLWTNVGVRLKGKGSFQPIDLKPCLALKWDAFAPYAVTQGLTKVYFHNGGQDRSMLREFLGASILQDAGYPAARVSHARVSFNGRDLGYYALIEAMNKPFLRRVFGNDSGNLYEGDLKDIDSLLEQDNGKVKDQTDLQHLCAIARIPDPTERWRRLPEILDVERFIDFLAVGRLMGHNDSYAGRRNNYRIYHDPGTDKMVFLHHSLKSTFRQADTSSLTPLTHSIVTKAVLQTSPGRKRYRDRLGQLFTNVYRVEVLTNRVQEALSRLLAESKSPEEATLLKLEAGKLCDIVSADARHIARELAQPDLAAPRFNTNGTFAVTGWQSTEATNVFLGQVRLDGRDSLHVRIVGSERASAAAWRTRVVLEPGKYRFSGRCRTAGVEVEETKSGMGAGLFVTLRPGTRGRYAGSEWKELSTQVEVKDGPQEVWLQCELRATNGEAWFEASSLQLVKAKEQAPQRAPLENESAEER